MLGAVVATGVAAPIDRVSALEASLFRTLNGLPDALLAAVWLPMQSGSFAAVPIVASIAWAAKRRGLAAATVSAGLAAYGLAKVVKRTSGRPRPAAVLSGVRERGGAQTGGGFPSGHAAVSAALASAAYPYLSSRWRAAAVGLAVAAPLGRVYVGAHLPLDVAGGSALGWAVGSLTRVIVLRSPVVGPSSSVHEAS